MNNKEKMGLRLKRIREEKGLSQNKLAKMCGWGASRIGNYETGDRGMNVDDVEVIADKLGIKAYKILLSESEWPSYENVSKIDIQPRYQGRYPLISSVQAGAWAEACEPYELEEVSEWYETTEKVIGKGFWLRVVGDSMTSPTGVSFPEGTMILVDTGRDHENKSLVVAKLTDVNEATFKRFVVDAGMHYLMPLNPTYKPIAINGNCKIIGVVIDAKLKLL